MVTVVIWCVCLCVVMLVPGRFLSVHQGMHSIGFYKSCMKNPGQLRRGIHCEFEEDEGIDASALRNEFLLY